MGRRDGTLVVELRQRARRPDRGRQTVGRVHGDARYGHERQEGEQHDREHRRPVRQRPGRQPRRQPGRRDREQDRVQRAAARQPPAVPALAARGGVAERPLEIVAALADQVPADMPRDRGRWRPRAAPPRRARPPCARSSSSVSGQRLREVLERVPIAIAALEVHRRVDARGVGPQHVFDRVHALEEAAPVARLDEADRGDRVRDGDLVRRACLVFRVQRLVVGLAEAVERALEPARHGRDVALLVARRRLGEPHEEGERVAARSAGSRSSSSSRSSIAGTSSSSAAMRRSAMRSAASSDVELPADAPREAAQVLDQGDAQDDGHGPRLADGERSDLLVGAARSARASRRRAASRCGRAGRPPRARCAGSRCTRPRSGAAARPRSRSAGRRAAVVTCSSIEVGVVEQPLHRRRHGAAGPDAWRR